MSRQPKAGYGNYTHPILPCTIEQLQDVRYRMQHSLQEANLDLDRWARGDKVMANYKLVWVYHPKGEMPELPKGVTLASPGMTIDNPLRPEQEQTMWLAFRVKPKGKQSAK